MTGHIDCYMDTSSFYSYLAFSHLLKNQHLLESHNVTVNFIPIFLGGVVASSGNKPPWSLPAKAKYGKYDFTRSKHHHGLPEISVPPFFPPVTLLPQRALCYIKSAHPPPVFAQTWLALFRALWTPPHVDITAPEGLGAALRGTGLFSEAQVVEVLAKAGEAEWKERLLGDTERVLGLGAFGAPWLWVTKGGERGEGEGEGEGGNKGGEPFFGSDRFHFIWRYLGIPWRDVEILPAASPVVGGEKAKL